MFLIGAYIYKNHDDFPCYHLTYALNLSENKFIVGTGIFSHRFEHFQVYLFSLYFIYAFYEFYLFHIGLFLYWCLLIIF